MASVTPPDMVLTLLEGITTIIHYCLLDPSTQYHQVNLSGWFLCSMCQIKDCDYISRYEDLSGKKYQIYCLSYKYGFY